MTFTKTGPMAKVSRNQPRPRDSGEKFASVAMATPSAAVFAMPAINCAAVERARRSAKAPMPLPAQQQGHDLPAILTEVDGGIASARR